MHTCVVVGVLVVNTDVHVCMGICACVCAPTCSQNLGASPRLHFISTVSVVVEPSLEAVLKYNTIGIMLVGVPQMNG